MPEGDRPKPGRGPSRRRRAPRPAGSGPSTTGLRLRRIGEGVFELDHPPCVEETVLDYEESLEIWEGGDPEGARDALRYALSACRDNLWVHEALGRIALQEFHDPLLAIGHFGYAVELASLAIPPRFAGTLPRDRRNNRPLIDAIEGLIECYERQQKPKDAARYRAMLDAWTGRRR